MYIKKVSPIDLAVDLISRSTCQVKVAAVLVDNHGIFSWGWNHSGAGYGMHAEEHCLRRSNRKRWAEATMYVAAARAKKAGLRLVTARPCEDCQRLLNGLRGRVIYRDKDGLWKGL